MVDAALKGEHETRIAALKRAAAGEDAAAMKSAIAEFEQAMQKLYQQASAAGGPPPGAGAGAGAAAGKGGDEDIKDADFEVK